MSHLQSNIGMMVIQLSGLQDEVDRLKAQQATHFGYLAHKLSDDEREALLKSDEAFAQWYRATRSAAPPETPPQR